MHNNSYFEIDFTPAKKEVQEYVEGELPYQILMQLYKNSRASLREMGKELGISYHVIQSVLRGLEEKYQMVYTLRLDENKLGFTEGQLITIKFGARPPLDFLKEILQKDIFVQDAYLTEGDFDLLLYVVGLGPRDFQSWQWNLRTSLSEYKPKPKLSIVNSTSVGFFPLRNDLIRETTVLSNAEKQVLVLLNENSRIKISEIAKKARISPNKTIYIIKKLRARGIIRNFTSLTQNPGKRLFYAYGVYLIPVKEHKHFAAEFAKELTRENLHEAVNDYSLIANTSGDYDAFYVCSFEGGEVLAKKGPDLLSNLWQKEEPRIEKAVITDILFGRWPFHLEEYEFAKNLLD